jgi:hypothetical protein
MGVQDIPSENSDRLKPGEGPALSDRALFRADMANQHNPVDEPHRTLQDMHPEEFVR